MPRNGSGTYSKPSGTTFVNNTLADADDVNELADDIATTLTASVAKDGQTTMTGNLPMGSNKLTGLAAGSQAGDSVRYEQVIGADPLAVTNLTIGGVKQHAYDWWVIAASDESTNITAAADKVKFHAPYAATVAAVYAGLSTAQTAGNIFTVDIHEAGTTILSTKITIDNNEAHSGSAATPPVISDASIAEFAVISIDVDQIGTAGAKGLKVYMKVSPT